MNLAMLNPFTLIRWSLGYKRLDEIVDFDKKRAELDSFHQRTSQRKARQEARIAVLEQSNKLHADDMGKARMLSDNLLVIMTQALGKSAPKSTETA